MMYSICGLSLSFPSRLLRIEPCFFFSSVYVNIGEEKESEIKSALTHECFLMKKNQLVLKKVLKNQQERESSGALEKSDHCCAPVALAILTQT